MDMIALYWRIHIGFLLNSLKIYKIMERQQEGIPIIPSDVATSMRARLQEELLEAILTQEGEVGVMKWLRENGSGVEALLGSGRLNGESEDEYRTRQDMIQRIQDEEEREHHLSGETLTQVDKYVKSHTHIDASIH